MRDLSRIIETVSLFWSVITASLQFISILWFISTFSVVYFWRLCFDISHHHCDLIVIPRLKIFVNKHNVNFYYCMCYYTPFCWWTLYYAHYYHHNVLLDTFCNCYANIPPVCYVNIPPIWSYCDNILNLFIYLFFCFIWVLVWQSCSIRNWSLRALLCQD